MEEREPLRRLIAAIFMQAIRDYRVPRIYCLEMGVHMTPEEVRGLILAFLDGEFALCLAEEINIDIHAIRRYLEQFDETHQLS